MDIFKATRRYEEWLAGAVPAGLVQPDLDHKHRLFGDPADPFPFFRGTYYRWAQRWVEAAGPLSGGPVVLAVGDLHVENYGTWRDAEGRLCWGVNDFDEADRLPYTHDLVRLAASVHCAKKGGVLDINLGRACEAILDGYRHCLKKRGQPFVLEEDHAHLRGMAMAADRDPVKFWEKMTVLLTDPAVEPPAGARAALVGSLPATGVRVAYRARPRAGVGSLGRPRYVALGEWSGGWVCREAKAVAPPATVWVRGGEGGGSPPFADAVAGAIRAPDPFYRVGNGWVVRRLGPRSSRIELRELVRADGERVMHAMGAEAANIHLASGGPQEILSDLDRRPAGWLEGAARIWRSQSRRIGRSGGPFRLPFPPPGNDRRRTRIISLEGCAEKCVTFRKSLVDKASRIRKRLRWWEAEGLRFVLFRGILSYFALFHRSQKPTKTHRSHRDW